MKQGTKTTLLAIMLLLLLLLTSSLFVIREGHSALLLRLGKLVSNDQDQPANYGPGLHFKQPLLNTVMVFDTRLQTLDIKSSRIVTQEKKDVIVDYYVKWRIGDLATYYKATGGNVFNAENLLEQLLNTSLRAEFGKRTIADVVSGERDDVMDILKHKADQNAEDLGVKVVDVRIKGIDLPSTTSSAIFQRMRANMEKIANRHRADGRGAADAIRANADRQATVITAEAKSQGQKIRAKGAATAEGIYASAYNQSPEFFAFYRSLKAYQKSFSQKDDLLVLGKEAQFFDYFQHSFPAEDDGHTKH